MFRVAWHGTRREACASSLRGSAAPAWSAEEIGGLLNLLIDQFNRPAAIVGPWCPDRAPAGATGETGSGGKEEVPMEVTEAEVVSMKSSEVMEATEAEVVSIESTKSTEAVVSMNRLNRRKRSSRSNRAK